MPPGRSFTHPQNILVCLASIRKREMASFEKFFQRVHPDDRGHVMETFDTLMQSGGDLDLAYRIAAPDSSVRYMHAIGHPVLKEPGTSGEYVGITIDITERRRLDQDREQADSVRCDAANIWRRRRDSATRAVGRSIPPRARSSTIRRKCFGSWGSNRRLIRRTRKRSGSESTLKIFRQLGRALNGLWRLPKRVGS